MKIDKKLVEQLANLAKLEFDEQSMAQIESDLNSILQMVDKLNELDTTGVEPLKYLVDEVNELRPDIVDDSYTKEDALRNAPLADSDYIKVPKVIRK